jgi:hypothetical protein
MERRSKTKAKVGTADDDDDEEEEAVGEASPSTTVMTGVSNGEKVREQQEKGRGLEAGLVEAPLKPPTWRHSVAVMYSLSLVECGMAGDGGAAQRRQ